LSGRKPGVEYDCIYGIANGVPLTIGDHFHPRGEPAPNREDLERGY
jgi:hypothetical protein